MNNVRDEIILSISLLTFPPRYTVLKGWHIFFQFSVYIVEICIMIHLYILADAVLISNFMFHNVKIIFIINAYICMFVYT